MLRTLNERIRIPCICIIIIILTYWNIHHSYQCRIWESEKHNTLSRGIIEILSNDDFKRYTIEGVTNPDDSALGKTIRQRWLVGPAKQHSKNLNRVDFSQHGQAQFIDKLLMGERNGFFVEAGAHDGRELSNTVFFEKARNWTGLLIEGDPLRYRKLVNFQRKAYSINACLSNTNMISDRKFTISGVSGISGAIEFQQSKEPPRQSDVYVQCFPLYALMAAMGIYRIDYFSLDVEGAELDILKTIPFEKLFIKTLSIEYKRYFNGKHPWKTDEKKSVEKLNKIRDFFKATGHYKEAGILPPNKNKTIEEGNGVDVIFMRKE